MAAIAQSGQKKDEMLGTGMDILNLAATSQNISDAIDKQNAQAALEQKNRLLESDAMTRRINNLNQQAQYQRTS